MRSVNWLTAICIGCSALVARAEDAKPTTAPAKPNQTAIPLGSATAPVSEFGAPVTVIPVAQPPASRYFFATQPSAPAKAAYLGVNTSPASPALAKQLQLKAGVGLVVDSVEPGSPAAQAGVKEFDILHKLDDQLIINDEQLAVLVRSFDAGREIKLTVIREGKPQTLTAKLAERTVNPMRLTWNGSGTLRPGTAPADPFGGGSAAMAGSFIDGSVTIVGSPAETLTVNTPDGKGKLRASVVMIEDDQHKMMLNNVDGHRRLKVQDKAGKVLFDGPVQTKAELDAVPPDLRRAYQDLLANVDVPATQPASAPFPAAAAAPKAK